MLSSLQDVWNDAEQLKGFIVLVYDISLLEEREDAEAAVAVARYAELTKQSFETAYGELRSEAWADVEADEG